MPDISHSNWSERDDHNAEVAPNGFPPGLPAQIETIGQMVMGAIKRFWNRSNPAYITAGSADNYTITTEGKASFLNLYEIIRVRIDRANTTTTPTLKFSSTTARTIVKVTSAGVVPLVIGDLQAGRDHSFYFNGTNFVLSNPATIDASVAVGLLKSANNLSDVADAPTSRTNLGLGNVNNTSDANKPVSTAQGTAIAASLATAEGYTDAGVATRLPLAGGKMTGGIQTLVAADTTDATKKAAFNLGGLTTATTRQIIVPDTDVALSKWEAIGTGLFTLTAASQLILTNLGAYRKIRMSGVLTPSGGGASLAATLSTNNGSTFDTGANYSVQALLAANTTVTAGTITGSALGLAAAGGADAALYQFYTELEEFNQNSILVGFARDGAVQAGIRALRQGTLSYTGTVARNALRLFPTGGTVTGLVLVEGVRG